MARLTSPTGATVVVAADKVDELVRRGFTKAKASEPAKKSAPKKSTEQADK